MKFKSIFSTAAALLLALSASNASAILIDLTSGSGQGAIQTNVDNDLDYYLYDDGDIVMTVTGYLGNDFSDREQVTRTSAGLGVDSDNADSDQLDGAGGAEWLRFDLNRSLSLTFLDFLRWGDSDDFSLIVDGTNMGILSDDPWFGNIRVEEWFAIGASDSSDQFTVRRLKVPEPGTLGLLVLGALGLGLARKVRA